MRVTLEQKLFVSHAAVETQKWGRLFGKDLARDCIVAFYGPLGSGKTTLIKAIIDGITEEKISAITSPTYAYLNEYQTEDRMIYHFDLYRLQGSEDFIECGFEEFFYRQGICLIEWAERIDELLPSRCLKIRLNHLSEMSREITLL